MGQTEIYALLKNIFSQECDPAIPRYIYLLTDGAVFNPNEVISLIECNYFSSKLFTFGIGSGVSI